MDRRPTHRPLLHRARHRCVHRPLTDRSPAAAERNPAKIWQAKVFRHEVANSSGKTKEKPQHESSNPTPKNSVHTTGRTASAWREGLQPKSSETDGGCGGSHSLRTTSRPTSGTAVAIARGRERARSGWLPRSKEPTRVGHIAAEFERLANVLLRRGCGNPALITYPLQNFADVPISIADNGVLVGTSLDSAPALLWGSTSAPRTPRGGQERKIAIRSAYGNGSSRKVVWSLAGVWGRP